MNKDELIVMAIIKTFRGVEVTDYPCKGIRISGGEKPVNPFPTGKLEKIKNGEN